MGRPRSNFFCGRVIKDTHPICSAGKALCSYKHTYKKSDKFYCTSSHPCVTFTALMDMGVSVCATSIPPHSRPAFLHSALRSLLGTAQSGPVLARVLRGRWVKAPASSISAQFGDIFCVLLRGSQQNQPPLLTGASPYMTLLPSLCHSPCLWDHSPNKPPAPKFLS